MFRVSCIQLCSGDCINTNLKISEKLIKKAVLQKADLIITPEVSSLFSLNKSQLMKQATSMSKDLYLKGIKKLSKRFKKWILIGSLIIKEKKTLFNRSVLIDPSGVIKAYYDKIHMYDARLSKKEIYKESKIFKPGKKVKTVKLPWGRIGLSVCFDLRFPNMYRQMSKNGALFLTVPSAFTETTGRKHWFTLIKARAIENFCYVFAPAQGGKHCNGRKTFGNSLIVSPDGKILKQLKKKQGVITTKIDPKISIRLRKVIPSLKSIY